MKQWVFKNCLTLLVKDVKTAKIDKKPIIITDDSNFTNENLVKITPYKARENDSYYDPSICSSTIKRNQPETEKKSNNDYEMRESIPFSERIENTIINQKSENLFSYKSKSDINLITHDIEIKKEYKSKTLQRILSQKQFEKSREKDSL